MFNFGNGKAMNFTKKLSGQKIAPYIFVSPFIISFIIFSIYPLIHAVIMSFQEIHGFGNEEWIGFDNYIRLLNDSRFYTALRNVGRYTFWTLMILIPLPMIISFMMNGKFTSFKNFFRTVYFLPVLTSSVIAGLVFRFAFSSESDGGFNQFLAIFYFWNGTCKMVRTLWLCYVCFGYYCSLEMARSKYDLFLVRLARDFERII